MKESNKLNISINFRTQPDSIATDEITYYWERIVGALLAVVIVIGLFIGGYSYYFDQDNAGNIAEGQTVFSESLEAKSLEAKSLEAKSSAFVDQIESKIEDISTRAPAEDITMTVNSETVVPHANENESKDIIQTASTEINTEISAIEHVDPDTLFTRFNSEIFSDKIKRFIISSSVNKNEPTGTIHDIIFDSNNLATVYAFSDVSNLEGTTLYYIWTLDDEDVATVKVKVGSARWRSYSRKFIQPNKHGKWKVELQNRKGEKLATSQFYY